MYQVITDSWQNIKSEIIIKASKKCGISYYINGEEDDILWDSGEEIIECTQDWDPYDDSVMKKI